jgi:flagellar biosynthesis protein FlhB
MAEEQDQERTERATPRRREEARRKGNVPRSKELAMTGVMLAGGAALLVMIEPMSARIASGLGAAFSIERDAIFDERVPVGELAALFGHMLAGLAPLAIVLVAAALLSSTSIGGWSFSLSALAFKGERLNPLKGIKRIFTLNSLNELVKAMAKFLLVALIAVTWLWWSVDELLALGKEPVATAIVHTMQIVGTSLLVVSSGLILISLADVPFQLFSYEKRIRMTRKEVRDELRETEGQPEVKSKIRFLQQQAATRRMMEEVPRADVVITNPTHFAVALRYDEDTMQAPRVVAKGKGLIAQRIREIAEASNVPLFSAPPLARALYRSARVGQEISPGLYTAVAQVLAYIFQIDAAARTGGKVARPEPPRPEVDESLYR